MSFGVIGLVVVIVLVLVLVKVTGGSSAVASSSGRTPAPATIVAAVTEVPASVFETVGVPASLRAPTVMSGESPLTFGGRPGVLYIGGEFCPYCAADRWPLVMALSRFGTFANLAMTNSSAYDSDPATATFSFYGSRYSSPYLTFEGIEQMGNDTTGPGTRRPLMPLGTMESRMWRMYSGRLGTAEGYPFLDMGNKVFTTSPPFNPGVLSGLDQGAIAAKLADPSDPVTRDIVGAANLLTAALCSITGEQPTPVCSAPATTAAARAIGLH